MSDQLSELEEFRALDEKRQFEILSDEEEARWEELRARLSEELAAATQVKAAPEPIELDIDMSASPDEPVALASNAEFVRAEGSEDDRGVSVDEVPPVELEVETGDLNQLTGSWTPDGTGAPPDEAAPAPEPIELEVSGDADEPVQLASGAEFLDNPELVNTGDQGWRREETPEGTEGGEAPASDDNKTLFSLGPADEESEENELEAADVPSADDDNKTMFSLGPVEPEESEEIELDAAEPAVEAPADDDNKTMFSLGPVEPEESEEIELEAAAPAVEAPADDDNKTMFSLGPAEAEV
ncbi:MAG: hypothetical protein FJ086_06125, partial [Deltaproteobacteria bacterium]|nr:hypothetical protein [Deltaproteobacteria bacterium]